MKLESKTAALGKGRIRYLQGGRGRPLLFLHGWPTNPNAHRRMLELLAESFTVHAPFLFDADCSGVAELSECVGEFMRQAKLKSAVVVGMSYGGAVASALATNSALVRELVLVNTAGLPRQASFSRMALGMAKSSAQMGLKLDISHLYHRLDSILAFAVSLRNNRRRSLFREIRLSTRVHACHVFSNVRAKTTIISCSRDEVFTAGHAEALKGLIKGSRLVKVEGGHHWALHQPEKFAETVLASLK